MPCINFNGNIVPSNTPVIEASNRGLRYGDGLFETMKWCNNSLAHVKDHTARLFKGLRTLDFFLPPHFTPEYLTHEIIKLVKNEKLSNARVRVTVIRGSGSIFNDGDQLPTFIIEATELSNNSNSAEKYGVKLGIYKEARKTVDMLSPLKHNNYLPYCMAAMYARKNGFDDAIILNQYGRICETSIANIFFIDKKTIFTPSLKEGCIEGIIRKNLIETLPALGFKIIETELRLEMIGSMDAAFITNSIINLKAVSGVGEKPLDVDPVLILKELIERKTQLFC